jgi:hypothetical protein
MADITKVKVGPCSVTFNGVDLGHTKGGVEVTYEADYFDASVDTYGSTPIESYLRGEKFSAKVPLAEYTIANLRNAIPNATFAGAANARITIGKQAGAKQSSVAYQLVLHPLNEGTRVNDIVIHKAFCKSPIKLSHTNDGEKIIECEFNGLLDESKSNGNYLGLIGDSTA